MILLAATIIDKAISLTEIAALLTFLISVSGCLWSVINLTSKITTFTLRLSNMDTELVKNINSLDAKIDNGFNRVTDAWKLHQNRLDKQDNRLTDLEEHSFIKSGFRKRRYNDVSGDLSSPDSY